MKKILALIIAIFCLSSVSVFATEVATQQLYINAYEDATVTISEDYYALNLGDESFVSFNLGDTDHGEFVQLKSAINLTEAQNESVEYVYLNINYEGSIIKGIYGFKNGGTLNMTYIKAEKAEEYALVKSDRWQKGKIPFYWPENNDVFLSRSQLLGDKVEVTINKADTWNDFDIYAVSTDGAYTVLKGKLLISDDIYFYLDFTETDIDSESFFIFDYERLPVYQITDKTLCSSIENAVEEYYHDDYGFFEDDNFTQIVSDVLLIIVFGVIPVIIFGIFFVSALRSKTKYRKIFRTIYILAILCLILFAIVCFLL